MSALTELQSAVADAATSLGPSVVAVGRGAGIVVGPDRVLTNAHNLTDPEVVPVRFADGRRADGTLAAADVDGDLAVVTVTTGGAPVAPFADEGPQLGQAVIAFGAPRSGSSRVTVGFVSAVERSFRGPRDRRIHGAVEHTAPLGRGSSGGPIVDVQGRVVGIDTHRRGDGFYLALPSSPVLAARIDALGRGEAPVRRRLGVAVATSEVALRLRAAVGLPPRDGVLIRDIDEDGPGAAAGLRVGDLLVAGDGQDLDGPEALLRLLDEAGHGAIVLTVLRGADEVTITVTD
ncbi:S1C family serine protease [Nitriliruptor alkaliphilus]|uniref:S1C family serine protease n=1 Tax=Nitriliruptor alkaliphilus TaxID=427918 RepID=UPI000698F394|nr:S1C family serine protease [Nitriliruptor alkaliphilus]